MNHIDPQVPFAGNGPLQVPPGRVIEARSQWRELREQVEETRVRLREIFVKD